MTGPDGGEAAGLDEADRLAVSGRPVREGVGVAGDGPAAALQGRLRKLAVAATGGTGDMAAMHPAQMLHQIGQRPLGAGRQLHVVAGHDGDRCSECDRLCVVQPQQGGNECPHLGHSPRRALRLRPARDARTGMRTSRATAPDA